MLGLGRFILTRKPCRWGLYYVHFTDEETEAPPQVLGLSQRPALPLGDTLPAPQGLGATSFGKGTQAEQTASSLAGLAIPNQFFLSSWEHSPELPSCHSFPSQSKAALFWKLDPSRGVAA